LIFSFHGVPRRSFLCCAAVPALCKLNLSFISRTDLPCRNTAPLAKTNHFFHLKRQQRNVVASLSTFWRDCGRGIIWEPTGDARGEAISLGGWSHFPRDRHHITWSKVSTLDRQGNTDSKFRTELCFYLHSGLQKKQNENSVEYFRASLKG